MNPLVVGIDAGLRKTGVVLLDESFGLISQNLVQVRSSSKAARRLVDIELALDSLISPYHEGDRLQIFIEGYAYGAKYQRESLAELGGVLRRYLYINGLDYWVIPPTSIKYFVTGNGKASKNYMKRCTKDKWGISFKSDDVCDAYGIARLGLTVLKTLSNEHLSLEAHEKEVIDDIVSYRDQFLNGATSKRKGKFTRKRKKK